MDISNVSNGKYKCKNNKINGGAYSKIYSVDKKNDKSSNKKNKNYIFKINDKKYKSDAIKEIEVLLRLKKNKDKFKKSIFSENIEKSTNSKNSIFSTNLENSYKLSKSKLVKIKDYYIEEDFIYTIFKKYDMELDSFSTFYTREFKETLPISLIKKITNSIFLGLYELNISKIIHCDIKPNNILIDLTQYKTIGLLFKDIKNNKISKDDMVKFIDIRIIDFNKAQKTTAVCKSINVQTLYYMPPEIVLGNRDFNSSIDVWASATIIYELITGLFLFDVFNINYKNEDEESDSESSSSGSSSGSSDSDSESDSDYYKENFENLALLHIYRSKFGDNDYVFGKYVDTFYSNFKLIGCMDAQFKKDKIEFNEIDILYNKAISEDDKLFYKNILTIFNSIFKYRFDNRLSPKEFICKFIF